MLIKNIKENKYILLGIAIIVFIRLYLFQKRR